MEFLINEGIQNKRIVLAAVINLLPFIHLNTREEMLGQTMLWKLGEENVIIVDEAGHKFLQSNWLNRLNYPKNNFLKKLKNVNGHWTPMLN